MVDDGLHLLVAQIRAEFHVTVIATKELSLENLDPAHTRGGGHFDGLEEREFFERPALHGDGEAGFGERGLGQRRAVRTEGKQCGGGGEHGEERAAFHGLSAGQGDVFRRQGKK